MLLLRGRERAGERRRTAIAAETRRREANGKHLKLDTVVAPFKKKKRRSCGFSRWSRWLGVQFEMLHWRRLLRVSAPSRQIAGLPFSLSSSPRSEQSVWGM